MPRHLNPFNANFGTFFLSRNPRCCVQCPIDVNGYARMYSGIVYRGMQKIGLSFVFAYAHTL